MIKSTSGTKRKYYVDIPLKHVNKPGALPYFTVQRGITLKLLMTQNFKDTTNNSTSSNLGSK